MRFPRGVRGILTILGHSSLRRTYVEWILSSETCRLMNQWKMLCDNLSSIYLLHIRFNLRTVVIELVVVYSTDSSSISTWTHITQYFNIYTLHLLHACLDTQTPTYCQGLSWLGLRNGTEEVPRVVWPWLSASPYPSLEGVRGRWNPPLEVLSWMSSSPPIVENEVPGVKLVCTVDPLKEKSTSHGPTQQNSNKILVT